MDALDLGGPPKPEHQRDAIHIAVVPAIATEVLQPGQHVGYRGSMTLIGIVDPFRVGAIQPGEGYWLCLYPGSTTPVRHEWSHPEIDKAESEAWLRKFADQLNETFDEVMRAAAGEFNNIDGCPEVDTVFWDHYFKFTGERGRQSDFLSCRC